AADDLDGDGNSDVVIGVSGDDTAGSNYGAVMVHWGGSWSGTFMVGSTDATLYGDGSLGLSVSLPGDISGDGVGDILLGSTGMDSSAGGAWLVDGSVSGTVSLPTHSLMNYTGENAGDLLGTRVTGGVDVDEDGKLDVALSAPSYNSTASDVGRVYVLPAEN
ncbi:MAG TPA: integrin alpha, partial [Myxococcota bacterium]|nr:integrin alpha [Myxococcota bacterium]